MTKYNIRSVTTLIALATIFVALGAFLFSGIRTNNKFSADVAPVISVQKVVLPDVYDKAGYKSNQHIASTATNIANGDFVMLNTESSTYLNDSGNDTTAREAVYISFGEATEISISNINIKLNGKQILSETFSNNQDLQVFRQYIHGLTPTEVRENSPTPLYSGDGESFSDLESGVSYITKYTTGENNEVASPEGRYDITIQYTDITATPSAKSWNFTFYLTTQKTYTTIFEKPTFNDTEKFELTNQESSMLHYFNYNNYYTTLYNENGALTTSANDKLYYPQLYFDPEKYEISYTRTLYNYIENVSMSFKEIYTNASQYGEMVVTTTTNTGISSIRTYNIAKAENGYIVRVQFDEVGEYIINKKARLRVEDVNNSAQYVTPTGEVITANAELLKPEKLIINGYTAKYANTRTTTATLYNDTYAYNAMNNPNTTASVIFAHDFTKSTTSSIAIATVDPTTPDEIYTADFTFLNTNTASLGTASVYDTNGLTSDVVNVEGVRENIFKDKSEGGLFNLTTNGIVRASTNLAPVMFDFYGKLQANASSWYAYRDSLGNVSINTYPRNYQFQEAGTYIVYLTYQNLIVESGQPTAGNGKTNQYCHQIFYFEITNTPAKAEIYTKATSDTPGIMDDTAKILNSGDFTNQYVYASWEASGPFDAPIIAKYYVYSWTDGTLLKEGNLNGLVYQKNKIVSTIAPTMLYGTNLGSGGLDGNYVIQVFRADALDGESAEPEAFVNHNFAIDTAPISGISAVTVNGSTLADANGEIDVFSKLTDKEADYTISTNQSFAWTWNDKESHANIYAKYVYASMQNINDYSLSLDYVNIMQAMATNKQAVLMPTNMQFGTFSSAIDYTKVDLNSPFATLSTSQIISTAQLAILLLYDDAGNTAIFATMLDKSETKILQDPLPNSYSNIITDDAMLYWGTHKSIAITTTSNTDGQIKDIVDYINGGENGFSWTLAGITFNTSPILQNAFGAIIGSNKIIVPIEKVTISTSEEVQNDTDLIPYQDADGTPHNWFAKITVNEPVDTTTDNSYTTQFLPNGEISAEHPLHALEDGEFYYSLNAIDWIGNSSDSYDIWVNLDRSRGAMQSYKTFDSGEGSSLGTQRGLNDVGIDKTTNRQTVANKYSTNRRYVTFSWTEPDATFSISTIVLKYYPFAYNSTLSSYPYSGSENGSDDDNATTFTIYDKSNPDEFDGYTFTYEGREYYQTKALMLIDYEDGYQSSPGKYVIIRTYDNFDEIEGGGDVAEKVYNYYVDRNPIIPADTSLYGSDIKLQFGHDKGDYADYPDYGDVFFNSFSRTTNSETFNDTINFVGLTPKTPEKIAIESNILPASVSMSTWISASGYSTYDKYFPANETIDPATASEYLNGLFSQYRNSSRIQVAVQYFRHISGTSYNFVSQTFYSSVPGNEPSDPYNCQSLDELDEAFTSVGRYRVILFDMANMTGVLRGNALSDFRKLTYNSELGLAPNYTIFNFELTGISPEFNFQAGENTFTNVDVNFNDVTNASKVRVTWTDPTDIYTAQIAFNNISITKTYYTKNDPKLDAEGNHGIGITTSYIFSNPTILTTDGAEYNQLISDGKNAIYKPTMSELQALLTQAMDDTSLKESTFYKIKIDGTYHYYIMMPKIDTEDNVNGSALNGSKLADVEYTATVHYIIADENNNEYLTPNTSNPSIYYQTTKSVYVDNTAPYQNLVELITNDVYLNSLNTYGTNFTQAIIDNIDNPSFSFLKSYAFAVPRGFSLDYINKYETGLNYYYFKRTNYTGSADQQTATSNETGSQNATIFSPARDDLFIPAYYKQTGSSSFTVFNEVGYYDIIEQDRAGNLRVYTIYVSDFNNQIQANIKDDNIDIYTTIQSGTSVNYNNEPLYTNEDTIVFNSANFVINTIQNNDKWLKFKIENVMGTEAETIYYAPTNTLTNLTFWNQENTTLSSLTGDAGIIARLNQFITSTAQAHANERGGCQIKLTISNRLQAGEDIIVYINTPGIGLITNEQEFLELITVNEDGTFTIKMPSMTQSNYLTTLRVFMNGLQQSSDSLLQRLPTSASDFTSEILEKGFTFRLTSNISYRFEFVDNFGNVIRYSYPTDTTLVKSLRFTGSTETAVYDSQSYTYTSSETRFVYQATSLRLKLTITDATENAVIYTNILEDGTVEALPLDSEYFNVVVNDLNPNIWTLIFHAPINIHYIFNMSVDNYTDSPENFNFAIYTFFPSVSLTDTAGSPLINQVTSKAVQIQWFDSGSLFSPYVTLVSPNGSEDVLQPQTVVSDEGVYQVRLYNSMGLYTGTGGTITFTIRLYSVSVYGVYQINSSGTTTQLTARDELYTFMFSNGISAPQQISVPHFVYLSSDRDFDRNIEIVCNEDKGLTYEVVDEYRYGNTRIYHVYGRTTHYLDTYFAVTCILSNTNNIALETQFTINGETPTVNQKNIYTKETDTEKSKAVLTWNTNYLVGETASIDVNYDNVYENFYTLELSYNSVKVGNFTSGNMTLTQSGIYTIRLHDAVGRNQYFGANFIEFTLTILNDVVYYVNDFAPIQYATFSSDVDLYIPQTFSGDLSKYDSMKVEIMRNNAPYIVTPNNGHYLFSEPGVYSVSMTGSIKSTVGTSSAPLLATYQFTILSPNEALASYEFSAITGYEVISIISADRGDITSEVRGENSKIHAFNINPENFGVGRYTVTVRYAGEGYNPSQDYTFSFWINNEEPTINCSRDWGSSSTAGFSITINAQSIYERVGNCVLLVNGEIAYSIDELALEILEPQTFNYSESGTYIVQLQSASGNILTSHRLTISVPLNTAAIILIVIACVVVIGVIVTFILMRTRMKVR